MTSERRGGWEVHSGYILTIPTLEALCTPPHTTLPCFLLASQPRATPVRGGGVGFLVPIPRKTSFNRSCVGGFGQVWGKAAGMFQTTWRRTRFSFPWYATDTYARVAEVAAEGRNSKACCSWPLNSGAWTLISTKHAAASAVLCKAMQTTTSGFDIWMCGREGNNGRGTAAL